MDFAPAFDRLKTLGYFVDDLLPPNLEDLRILFLMESPHVDEVKTKLPLSGKSGMAVTSVLTSDQLTEPFGPLLSRIYPTDKGSSLFHTMGIMEVSPYPMQANVYPQSLKRNMDINIILKSFKGIRGSVASAKHNDPNWNTIRRFIEADFISRLQALTSLSITIVPCGRLAETFLKRSRVTSLSWRVLRDVPHPSHDQWSTEDVRAYLRQQLGLD